MFDTFSFISRPVKKSLILGGTDEVGRGPLAGPVVACSICTKISDYKDFEQLDSHLLSLGVTDSKKLSEKKRFKILHELNALKKNKLRMKGSLHFANHSLDYSIKKISPLEIDKINIFQASLKAMKKSILEIGQFENENLFFIDGKFIPRIAQHNLKLISVIKGDEKSTLIGLASILAKYYRDHLMNEYDLQYPEFLFAKNSGYPTKHHKEVLRTVGPSPIHRKTFKGVREWFENKATN